MIRMVCRSGFVLAAALMALGAAPQPDGYTFLWWAHGWGQRSPEGRQVLHVQTRRYGAAFDVERAALTRLGPIASPLPYGEAVAQANEVITARPEASLRLAITAGGTEYVCRSAAGTQDDRANFPVRIIESGRTMQRFDILQLAFTAAGGARLDVEARLEVVAWPERLHIVLAVAQAPHLADARFALDLEAGGSTWHVERSAAELAVVDDEWLVPLVWEADAAHAPSPDAIEILDRRGGDVPVPVTHDAARGWYYVDLPERSWEIAAEPDRLDRFAIALHNPSSKPQTFPLLFAFDGAFPGITGMSPMLRDASGRPTGIPVQISKNWHRLPDRRFRYEGPWFHGASRITVPPGGRWSGELAIAYARWGGVPAASHAQLCLVGWGTNQLWDQAAIGSWGESICYDPDVNLERSMIDDMRPLMVTGMRGGQWEWTHNVGGGDFLVYADDAGQRQALTRMRTAYLAQGPNLTRVVYAGVTADGAIAARIEVASPRCDDVNRAHHRVRYEVLKPARFSRLAFYQVGADRYNDHQFKMLARGNRDGLIEEWAAPQGGKAYHRGGIVCEGARPWFSLHGGIRSDEHEQGAWANRVLIVHAWRARLGGAAVDTPHAAVYGTENRVPSANVELAPPPGLNRLEPGDFVEFDVELLVVPVDSASYYGPNAAFRTHLGEHADTWRVIHRFAAQAPMVTVTQGTLERAMPIAVAVDGAQSAAFEVEGGVGYVPIVFLGLDKPAGFELTMNGRPVDQQVHGNDFWQTDYDDATGTYVRTYNVSLDGPGPRAFHFGPAPAGGTG